MANNFSTPENVEAGIFTASAPHTNVYAWRMSNFSSSLKAPPITGQYKVGQIIGYNTAPAYDVFVNLYASSTGSPDYAIQDYRRFRTFTVSTTVGTNFSYDGENPAQYSITNVDATCVTQQDATTLVPSVTSFADNIIYAAAPSASFPPPSDTNNIIDQTDWEYMPDYFADSQGVLGQASIMNYQPNLFPDSVGFGNIPTCVANENITDTSCYADNGNSISSSYYTVYDINGNGSSAGPISVTCQANVSDEYTTGTDLSALYSFLQTQDMSSLFTGSVASNLGCGMNKFPCNGRSGGSWIGGGYGTAGIPPRNSNISPYAGQSGANVPKYSGYTASFYDGQIYAGPTAGFIENNGTYDVGTTPYVLANAEHGQIMRTKIQSLTFGGLPYAFFEYTVGGGDYASNPVLIRVAGYGVMNYNDIIEFPAFSVTDFPFVSTSGGGAAVTGVIMAWVPFHDQNSAVSWYTTQVVLGSFCTLVTSF